MTNKTVTFNTLTHKIVPIEPTIEMIKYAHSKDCVWTWEEYRPAYKNMIEAAPEYQESQWMPIDTAPKDGTDVIVMYMNIDTQIVHNAFYASEDNGWEASDVGWWSYDKGEVSRIHLTEWMSPTHWMPLPPAPEGVDK